MSHVIVGPARLRTLIAQWKWVPRISQNVQSFNRHGDVFIWVKNSRVGLKLQTNILEYVIMYLLLMLFCTPISMIYQCTEKLECDNKNLQYQVMSKQKEYTYFIKKKCVWIFQTRIASTDSIIVSVCLEFFRSARKFSLIGKRHHYRWGLQILSYTRHLRPLSSDGSLTCHGPTLFNGPLLGPVTPTHVCCWALVSWAVSSCIEELCLSQQGIDSRSPACEANA